MSDSKNHNEWFNSQVMKALEEADKLDAVFIPHDEVYSKWDKRRDSLRQALIKGKKSPTVKYFSIDAINREIDNEEYID